MARTLKSKRKRAPKTILKLPDLEQSKSAVLSSPRRPVLSAPTTMRFASSLTGIARSHGWLSIKPSSPISNFAGAAAIRSVNNQPPIGSGTSARLRSFRLWRPES